MAKYDQIGLHYNTTRTADPALLGRMTSLLNLGPNESLLDIGCGTGNYTKKIADLGVNVIGVDPSEKMLEKARLGSKNVAWLRGSAESIPVDSSSVNAVLASLTTHHWSDLTKGFSETARITQEGGSIVIFTSTPAQMKSYWLNEYFPQAMEKSMIQMPTLKATKEALLNAGYTGIITEPFFASNDLQDLFLQSGKHRPELYLQPEIRSGISTFSSLATDDEIASGLVRLEEDIQSGKIYQLIEDYDSDQGDYLFIKAVKLS